MPRTAQAEFALILGLLIIAVVVGLYAYSAVVPPSIQPSTLTEDQKAVDAYVKDAIRKASAQALSGIYNQGGYVDASGVKAVEYGGNRIAYWQLCGTTSVPDIRRNLELGIENLLKSNLPARTDVAGRIVTFDKSQISADAQLFENMIGLSVRVPTTVGGRPMPQPYSIDLRSNLGRIYEFSKDFNRLQGTYRALDYNLLRLIRRSNPKSCWLPTRGATVRGSLSMSWTQLRDCMMELVFHNMANTFEWEKPVLENGVLPKNMLGKSWIFEVVKQDGTWHQYKELQVDFYYGGGDEKLTRNSPELLFGTSPDPVSEKGESFSILGNTIGPLLNYNVKYNVAFPVIISVWDPLMERSFKFTNFVNIKGNAIASDCKMESAATDEYNGKCILGATQPMNLTVLDQNGAPLSAVDVRLDGCGPWRVFNGGLQVNIPSLAGAELQLSHEYSGSEYAFCTNSDELREKTVRFPIKRVMNANFYVVRIAKSGSTYRITAIEKPAAENITAVFNRAGNPCMNSTSTIIANYDPWGGREAVRPLDIYPTEIYGVVLISNLGLIEMDGLVVSDAATSINVYAPVLPGFAASDVEGVKRLFSACGMQPASTEYYGSKVGCAS
jgi:hypothetical protein